MERNVTCGWILPAFTIGIVCTLLWFAVFAYSKLFPFIEAAHTDHYLDNVHAALSQREIDRALKIAHRATLDRPDDPLAYTVYGRVLLESGNAAPGLDELRKVLV